MKLSIIAALAGQFAAVNARPTEMRTFLRSTNTEKGADTAKVTGVEEPLPVRAARSIIQAGDAHTRGFKDQVQVDKTLPMKKNASFATSFASNLAHSVVATDAEQSNVLMCGIRTPRDEIALLLNPPKSFQDFMSFAFGVGWGVSTIGSTTSAAADQCAWLEQVMGEQPAAWVAISDGPTGLQSLREKIFSGESAEDQIEDNCNQRPCNQEQSRAGPSPVEKLTDTETEEADGSSSGAVLPICMAARPCGRRNERFGTGVSFGVALSIDIPVYPPLSLSIKGFAASTFGDLTFPALATDLWGGVRPSPAHAIFNFALELPVGVKRGNSEVSAGSFELDVHAGAYGELNGTPDVGKMLSAFTHGFGSNGLDLSSLTNAVDNFFTPHHARLQLFANADLTFTPALDELTGLSFLDFLNIPIDIGGGSMMIDFNYISSNQVGTATIPHVEERVLATDRSHGIRLGICEGDCNDNDDCDEGLVCHERGNERTPVPGCDGVPPPYYDYCIPETVGQIQSSFNDPPPGRIVGLCEGDCDNNDQCAEGLVCYQREDENTLVPGCSGVPPAHFDYCVPDFASRNTWLDVRLSGGVNPEEGIKDFFTSALEELHLGALGDWVHDALFERVFQLELEHVGWDPRFTLNECQGDCDNDNHCLPGLVCLQREKGEKGHIPGCTGEPRDDWNYCIKPELKSLFDDPPGDYGDLGLCEGDCEPGQCEAGLTCYERDPSIAGTEGDVPGCHGTPPTPFHDYCVPEDALLTDCASLGSCGLCEGGCINDGDCGAGLECHNSADGAPPGCFGTPDDHKDYCVRSTTSSVTGNSGTFSQAFTFKQMLRIRGDETFDFGLEVGFSNPFRGVASTVFCGALNTFLDIMVDVLGLLEALIDVGGLRNIIEDAQTVVASLCRATEYTFRLGFKDGRFISENTCVGWVTDGNHQEVCLPAFPSCPSGAAVGDRCSSNSDCTSGYCLNNPTWKTSIACSGTCIAKLDGGGDCSDDAMNVLLPNPFDAEHAACRSNRCYCGRCASTSSIKLPRGARCSTNADCETGYCLSSNGCTALGCTGTCSGKQPEGADCSPLRAGDCLAGAPWSAAHEFCESDHCFCSRCTGSDNKLANGLSCDTDCACRSGNCEGGFLNNINCSGRCVRADWRFYVDLVNRDGGGRTGTSRSPIWVEFYSSRGVKESTIRYNGGWQSNTQNIYTTGVAVRPAYIVVKVFGDDALGIDQAGFFSNGHQFNWFGGENGGSYWLSSDSEGGVASSADGPCMLFVLSDARNAEKTYYCAQHLKGSNYNRAALENLVVTTIQDYGNVNNNRAC